MPSVNPIQPAEPRMQNANKQQAPNGDPFSEVLDSVSNKRSDRDEARAERSARRDQPSAPASRGKARADALERGDQPKGEVHEARRAHDEAVKETVQADAPAAEKPAAPKDVVEAPADDQQAEVTADAPDAPIVTAAAAQPAADQPTGEMAAQANVVNTAPESAPVGEESVAPEIDAAPAEEPKPEVAKSTAPTTVAPEVAQADPVEETPVVATPKAVTAPQTASADEAVEETTAAPSLANNARSVAAAGQGQSQDIAASSQSKTPAVEPTVAAPEDAEQPVAQQSNAPQSQTKPQESASARPAETNAPVPSTPSDSAAPKAQPNPAQSAPVPEPVRAMNASFEQTRINLSNGTEVRPTPINITAVAVEIASRMRDGLKRFDIRLDPPELGRVDVRLEVDRNGNVSTKLTVERPETLDLMQRDARNLERALQQAGLKTDSGGLEFSLRQNADDRFAQGQHGFGRSDSHAERTIGEGGEPAEAVAQGYYRASAFARGGVDITV